MPLKFRFAKKEEIPSEQQSFYVEREGAWVLDCDGVVEKVRLDEFRNNNVALKAKLDELTKRFEGIDPETARNLAEEKKALEDQIKAGTGGEIDKVIVARLKPLQDQLTLITTERETLNRQLKEKQVNEAVLASATKRGLRASAHEDIILRASRSIKIENGVPKVIDAAGNVRYGQDAITPMTLDAWVDLQTAEAPHLFESNSGGGASGNGSGGAGGSTENPWKKDTFNLTKQGALMTSDPARARALAAQAGVKLAAA